MSVIDFSEELEHINRALEKRQTLLPTVDPEAPHPTCTCKHTWREHLESEIQGLTALKELIDGDIINITRLLGEMGPGYIIFVVSHVFDPEYVERATIPWRQMKLVAKMRDRFKEVLGQLPARRPRLM